MPNYTRIRMKGGTYFFTVVTYHRKPFLSLPYLNPVHYYMKLLYPLFQDILSQWMQFAFYQIICIAYGPFLKKMKIIPCVGLKSRNISQKDFIDNMTDWIFPIPHDRKGVKLLSGKDGSGSISYVMKQILKHILITFISIQ